jgi:hypothetical protein
VPVALFVVVRASQRQKAAAAAAAADPVGGTETFLPGVPLRVAGDAANTAVAFWCRWVMTDAERESFDAAMGGLDVLTADRRPDRRRSVWAFDATDWTPAEVLAALVLDTLDTDLT